MNTTRNHLGKIINNRQKYEMRYGTALPNDNLKLCMDLYNVRSYTGEPTLNLLSLNGDDWMITGGAKLNGDASVSDLGNGRALFTNSGDTSTFRFRCREEDLIDGEIYACQVKIEDHTGPAILLDWCDTTDSSFSQAGPGEGTEYTGWVISDRSDYTSTYRFFDILIQSGTSAILSEHMVAYKDHLTTYTSSERSATNAWKNLAANNLHGTLDSASFDSLGEPLFSTGEEIDLSSILSLVGDFTISIVLHQSTLSGGSTLMANQTTTANGKIAFNALGNLVISFSGSGDEVITASPPVDSTVFHLGLRRSGTTVTSYINGTGLTPATSVTGGLSLERLGGDADDGAFESLRGKIYHVAAWDVDIGENVLKRIGNRLLDRFG